MTGKADSRGARANSCDSPTMVWRAIAFAHTQVSDAGLSFERLSPMGMAFEDEFLASIEEWPEFIEAVIV